MNNVIKQLLVTLIYCVSSECAFAEEYWQIMLRNGESKIAIVDDFSFNKKPSEYSTSDPMHSQMYLAYNKGFSTRNITPYDEVKKFSYEDRCDRHKSDGLYVTCKLLITLRDGKSIESSAYNPWLIGYYFDNEQKTYGALHSIGGTWLGNLERFKMQIGWDNEQYHKYPRLIKAIEFISESDGKALIITAMDKMSKPELYSPLIKFNVFFEKHATTEQKEVLSKLTREYWRTKYMAEAKSIFEQETTSSAIKNFTTKLPEHNSDRWDKVDFDNLVPKAKELLESTLAKEAIRQMQVQAQVQAERNREIERERAERLEKEKMVKQFQKSIMVESKTNCGPVIEIKGNLIKVYSPVSGFGNEHWLSRDSLFPVTYSCNWRNGVYAGPNHVSQSRCVNPATGLPMTASDGACVGFDTAGNRYGEAPSKRQEVSRRNCPDIWVMNTDDKINPHMVPRPDPSCR
jgi:hypothetical protein